ncbi:MAG: DUF1670 domain-containing protein [Desulfobacteraceae bacterium]|nr:DUF1670 domain-containing protein [Desulfobacteraceae bacterium]
MNQKPDSQKRYNSAKERFLGRALVNFFSRELPRLFGPVMREKIADEIMTIINDLNVDANSLKPGQILWNALDKSTRGDSPRRRYKAVVLTIVNEEDIEYLANGGSRTELNKKVVARMINEAYEQGGILSMRDIALLTLRTGGSISAYRKAYEEEHNVILPHTGVLHDMGSCITHKGQIIRKVYIEKKDPVMVSKETRHTQKAVDRYLTDFNRVRCAYEHNTNTDYVHIVTGISKCVVKQYFEIIKEIEKTS